MAPIIMAASLRKCLSIFQTLDPYPASPPHPRQGYTKLLKTLGCNVVEFLSNLNSLHLHLGLSFPAMKAPAFKCDKVRGGEGVG